MENCYHITVKMEGARLPLLDMDINATTSEDALERAKGIVCEYKLRFVIDYISPPKEKRKGVIL